MGNEEEEEDARAVTDTSLPGRQVAKVLRSSRGAKQNISIKVYETAASEHLR